MEGSCGVFLLVCSRACVCEMFFFFFGGCLWVFVVCLSFFWGLWVFVRALGVFCVCCLFGGLGFVFGPWSLVLGAGPWSLVLVLGPCPGPLSFVLVPLSLVLGLCLLVLALSSLLFTLSSVFVSFLSFLVSSTLLFIHLSYSRTCL